MSSKRDRAGTWGLAVLTLIVMGVCAPARAELHADQLLLIVNKNVPESYALARHYAQVRQVPEGRILAIPLPVGGDQIPFEMYQHDVVPVVRDFLKKNNLEQKVACLVTFYGMPLRIASWQGPTQGDKELGEVQHLMVELPEQVLPQVQALEKLVEAEVPDFHANIALPSGGAAAPDEAAYNAMGALHGRMEAAWHALGEKLRGMPVGPAREDLMQKVQGVMNPLLGPMVVMQERVKEAEAAPPQDAAQRAAVLDAARHVADVRMQLVSLQHKNDDAAARAQMRQLVRDNFSPFDYIRLLQAQVAQLKDHSVSAFDNELALLWWENYQHAGWEVNPLRGDGGTVLGAPPAHPTEPVLMVMRLDAPSPELVRQMIDVSARVEEKGLQGQVVIDSQGKVARDPSGAVNAYGVYDEALRRAALLIRSKTKLKVTLDENPQLLPAWSQKDVALYCGWYSLRQYIPCCRFNDGAIGFHVASGEMISLHQQGETGWCANLIRDNCVATLGPVAEPYLLSFPDPDAFFPLLLTGKLTLAEVYWKTTPATSWMICMVGDPLYTPYKNNPQLKVEDLPPKLQAFLQPGSGPATQSAVRGK